MIALCIQSQDCRNVRAVCLALTDRALDAIGYAGCMVDLSLPRGVARELA